MNLRSKAKLINITTFGGLFLILALGSVVTVLRSFSAFEERLALQRLQRVMASLGEIGADVDRRAKDWGAWDDAVDFVNGSNTTFIARNLMDETFGNLQLGFIAFFDKTGGTVWARMCMPSNTTSFPMPPDTRGRLQALVQGPLQSTTNSTQGLLILRQGTFMVSVWPVISGTLKGPVHGAVAMGRFIDSQELHRIGQALQLTVELVPVNPAMRNSSSREAVIERPSNARLVAERMLDGMDDASCARIRMIMPRDIWREGVNTTTFFLVTLLISGLVFSLVNLAALDRLMLRVVSSMSGRVAQIGSRKDFAARLPASGDDEISELARNINGMLAALAESQNAEIKAAEQAVYYHATLVQMAKLDARDALAARARMLEMAAAALDVERASFWRFSPFKSEIVCEDLYLQSSDSHTSGDIMAVALYADYFKELERQHSMATYDAVNDPRTACFAEHYLKPLNISSGLDVPVRLRGEVVGSVCFEHVGQKRHWTAAEQEFARAVADLVALVLESAERAHAERALRESQHRLALAQRFARVGIWDWDIVTNTKVWSSVTKEIYGLPDDTVPLTREQFTASVHPDDRAMMNEAMTACLERGEEYNIEHRIVQPSGTVRWVAEKGNVVRDDQGRPLRMLGTTMDVTDRKAAEEALEAETEQLAVTLRSIGDAVITTDTSGCVLLINKAAERLTGWQDGSAQGRPLPEVFHVLREGTRMPRESPVDRVLRSGTVVAADTHAVLISRDGTEHLIEDSGAPIRDRDSKTVGVILVFRDVTARRAMEEELYKAQKLESVGVLAGGIAHDFNNILTVILGNISLAKMQGGLPAATGERLTDAENAITQAMSLTHQLLTFSKGGLPVKKVVSVASILRDTVGFACRGSSAEFALDIEEGLWPVFADGGQIGQVVNNLVLNAIQSMSGSGNLTVSARNVSVERSNLQGIAPGCYIRISVTDADVGIPKEHLDRIFDPYFTTKQKGSGLGLAVSYSIIRNHEGYINVESEPGHGSTFNVWLPATDEALEQQAVQSRQDGPATGRILVMDDEQIVLRTTCALLARIGYAVETAADGEEAVVKFTQALDRNKRFDAVILDLTIKGGMGGKDTIQKLLALDPRVRAIASSGYSTDPVMAEHRTFGFAGALKKPYSLNELQDTLRIVMSAS